jgi:hypothetical protein
MELNELTLSELNLQSSKTPPIVDILASCLAASTIIANKADEVSFRIAGSMEENWASSEKCQNIKKG